MNVNSARRWCLSTDLWCLRRRRSFWKRMMFAQSFESVQPPATTVTTFRLWRQWQIRKFDHLVVLVKSRTYHAHIWLTDDIHVNSDDTITNKTTWKLKTFSFSCAFGKRCSYWAFGPPLLSIYGLRPTLLTPLLNCFPSFNFQTNHIKMLKTTKPNIGSV